MQDAAQGHVSLVISGGVARITIDRPSHRNALSAALRSELAACIERAAADVGTRVIVLTGAGEKAFVAGADIEELQSLDPAGGLALSREIARLHARIGTLPVPVVAAIRGWCLGGGLELALAADIRLANASARLGLPEIRLGILPGGGGIARMKRLAGPVAATLLCMTGAVVDAERALRLNLVSEVVPDEAFDARLTELADDLARSSGPALQAMKRALALEAATLEAAVEEEAQIGAALYGTDGQQGAMAAFLEERARRRAGL